MVSFQFEGLMAPVFTPFHDDGSLNLAVVPAYAQHLRDTSVSGAWLLGTAGEGMSLTVAERKAVAEAWLACRDVIPTIVVQCGALCLTDTKELARHAAGLGASGVAVLPNLFDKPQSVEALADYLQEVATAAPATPLLYYHIPMKTAVDLPMGAAMEEAAKRIPNFCGLKFTDGDVGGEGAKCLKAGGGRLTVFNGFDQHLQEAVSLGFRCGVNVCYNYNGRRAAAIFDLMTEGRVDEARQRQKEINDTQDLIMRQTGGFSVAGVKGAMTLLTGIDVGPSRLPVKPLTKGAMEGLKKDLAEAGML